MIYGFLGQTQTQQKGSKWNKFQIWISLMLIAYFFRKRTLTFRVWTKVIFMPRQFNFLLCFMITMCRSLTFKLIMMWFILWLRRKHPNPKILSSRSEFSLIIIYIFSNEMPTYVVFFFFCYMEICALRSVTIASEILVYTQSSNVQWISATSRRSGMVKTKNFPFSLYLG